MNIWNLWLVSVIIRFHPPRFKPFWQGFPYYTCFFEWVISCNVPSVPFLSSRIFGPLMSRWKASEFLVQPIGQVWSVPSIFSRIFFGDQKIGEKKPVPWTWWLRIFKFWKFHSCVRFLFSTYSGKQNKRIYIIIYLYIQVFLLKNA